MVSDEITEHGLSILRSAFEPLRCVAELYDYQSKARFRVFSQTDEPLLCIEKIDPFVLGDRLLLSEIIEAARNEIVNRDIALNPWSMPRLNQPSSGSAI